MDDGLAAGERIQRLARVRQVGDQRPLIALRVADDIDTQHIVAVFAQVADDPPTGLPLPPVTTILTRPARRVGPGRRRLREDVLARRLHVVDPLAVIAACVDDLVLEAGDLPATRAARVEQLVSHRDLPSAERAERLGHEARRLAFQPSDRVSATTGSSTASQARWRRPCSTTAACAMSRGAAVASERASSARSTGLGRHRPDERGLDDDDERQHDRAALTPPRRRMDEQRVADDVPDDPVHDLHRVLGRAELQMPRRGTARAGELQTDRRAARARTPRPGSVLRHRMSAAHAPSNAIVLPCGRASVSVAGDRMGIVGGPCRSFSR